jgi:hypothetical protein
MKEIEVEHEDGALLRCQSPEFTKLDEEEEMGFRDRQRAMTECIDRLRDMDEAKGRQDGEKWAMESASPHQLRWLAHLRDSPEELEKIRSESFFDDVNPWPEYGGEPEELKTSRIYRLGFLSGALRVWDLVRRSL